MKIFLNTYPNNTNFNGRLPYPKEFLDKTIKSYVDENVPAKIIHAKTGLSLNTIAKWVRETYNTTIRELYKSRRYKLYNEEFKQLYEQGKTPKEIAEALNVSVSTVYDIFKAFNIAKTHNKHFDKMYAQIPEMVNSGYTVAKMSNNIDLSRSAIHKWIKKTYNNGIVDVRRMHKIALSRDLNPRQQKLKDTLQELIENQGKTIKETSEIMNIRKSEITRLMRMYNIVSKKQAAKGTMKEKIQEFIKRGLTIPQMVEEIGNISNDTIRRYICKIYGKTYRELKKEIKLTSGTKN